MNQPAPATPANTWIVDARFDNVFFFGASTLGFAAALLMMAMPASALALLWIWYLFFEGPHLVATWQRTYLDARERRERRRLLVLSLLVFVPGLILWALSTFAHWREPFMLVLVAGALASWNHTVRQHYGIYAIYAARARMPAHWVRFDRWFIQLFVWWLFLASAVAIPANSPTLGPLLGPLARSLHPWVAALTLAAVAVYAASMVRRAREGVALKPAWFALLAVMGLLCFIIFVLGLFEPLFVAPEDPEQRILATTIAGGLVHSLQYLGIVFACNRRRYAAPDAPQRGWIARLGRSAWLAYALMVLISLGYVWINGARSNMPGYMLFERDGDMARLFVALYWGLFFHHYLLDQYIWRVRTDPRLRMELGLA